MKKHWETDAKKLRDYGLADCTSMIDGVPRVIEIDIGTCPNCKCENLMVIEIPVKTKLLDGGSGVGTYVGCPACPYASPMISRATATAPASEEEDHENRKFD